MIEREESAGSLKTVGPPDFNDGLYDRQLLCDQGIQAVQSSLLQWIVFGKAPHGCLLFGNLGKRTIVRFQVFFISGDDKAALPGLCVFQG